MLYLAVEYNNNQLNPINIIGLAICLTGIVFHCVLKFYTLQSTIKPIRWKDTLYPYDRFVSFIIEEKSLNSDPALTERVLYHRIDSVDEWSIDGDLNTRRSSADD